MHQPDPPITKTSDVSTFARFRLKVQTKDGRVQWLDSTESSEADAVRSLASRGLRVLAVESTLTQLQGARSTRSGSFPLLLFSQELLALLDAGLNLNEALHTLHAKEQRAWVQSTLAKMLEALRQGRSFSDVLGMFPFFPEVYVATVRAAERTGDLPRALARYIAYQLQFETIRKKLVSTAIYPVMLLLVGGFVTLFLMGYVVPRFSAVYESSGREVPVMSRALLSFGHWVGHHWVMALTLLIGVFAVCGMALVKPAGRAWILAQVLRLPGLAKRADEFRMARFYRAVSLLLASGIALPRAMGMVTGLLGPRQQILLAQCRLAVEQGQSLSAALKGSSLATPVAESLIKVGERSGQMAEMLERTARFIDDEFSRWVDVASRLLEPLLMVIIGLVIGAVVVLMYMPIFELAGSL